MKKKYKTCKTWGGCTVEGCTSNVKTKGGKKGKKKVAEKSVEKQIVEIHVYIHQEPQIQTYPQPWFPNQPYVGDPPFPYSTCETDGQSGTGGLGGNGGVNGNFTASDESSPNL